MTSLSGPERRQNLVLDAMPEIGRVEHRELFRAQDPDRLAALDQRLDQVRGVPLRRHDVVALGFQPGLEQLALRGLAGPVGTLEGDQQTAPARGVRKPLADALPDRAAKSRRRVGWSRGQREHIITQ